MAAVRRLRIQACILDRDSGAMREREKDAFLRTRECSLLAVVDAEDAEDLAVDFDRHVEERSNTFDIGDAMRDARIVPGILHRDWLTTRCDASRDALTRSMRHLRDDFGSEAARRTWHEVLVSLIPHQDRGHVC